MMYTILNEKQKLYTNLHVYPDNKQLKHANIELKRKSIHHKPLQRGKDTCMLKFQLYNGTRLERLFYASDTLKVFIFFEHFLKYLLGSFF